MKGLGDNKSKSWEVVNANNDCRKNNHKCI